MTRKKTLGIVFAIASAVLFGLCAALTKLVTAAGASVGTVLFSRGILGASFLLLFRLAARKPVRIARENRWKVAMLGLLGTAATLMLLNLAYCVLPVGTVTTIHFLYPAAVAVLSALLFKEKVSPVTVVTLVISSAAMLLFFESFSGDAAPGVVFAVLSVFTWSFQLLFLEHSGILAEDKSTVALYVCVVTALVGAVYGLATGGLNLGALLPVLPLVALIALLNNVLATVFCAKGVENIGAGLAAVFSVFEPIGSIVFGALLLGERMTPRQGIACGVILVSITGMIVWEAYQGKKGLGAQEGRE